MWSEILLIKARLDDLEARKMEKNLNVRFAGVAKKFGRGLIGFLKGGAIAGIGLGLLNKLLNPLAEAEERIKKLLDQSDDINDRAEKYGGTAGDLFKLEQLGTSVNLKPEALTKMLDEFKEKITLARTEIANPTEGVHRSTEVLKQFAQEKDLIQAFFRAIQSIAAIDEEVRRTPRDKMDPIRRELLLKQRQVAEESIFGEKLTGGERRLVELDFSKQMKQIGALPAQTYDQRFNRLEEVSLQNQRYEAKRNLENFLRQSAYVTPGVVKKIDQGETIRQVREAEELKTFEQLKEGQNAINEVTNLLTEIRNGLVRILGFIAPMDLSLKKLNNAPAVRNVKVTSHGARFE